MIGNFIRNFTLYDGLFWSFVSLLCLLVGLDLRIEYRARRLGAIAPRARARLPIGFDFIYRAMKFARQGKELEFWYSMLNEASSAFPVLVTTFEIKLKSYTRNVLTLEPENIKALLTTQFGDYGKGKEFHREWKDFLGDSIFATDGELWSRSRQLIRPMFNKERYVDTEIFEKHIAKLIPMLGGSSNADGNDPVDVGPFFYRYTLDAATDYLLGHSVDSLDDPKTEFAEVFRSVMQRQSQLFRAGPIRKFMSEGEFRRNLKRLDQLIEPFIHQALSLSPEELDKKLSSKDTFIHALARFTRDPVVVRDQLVAILLAGRDTTATTLSLCLFELSRHPDVVRKLREEIALTCSSRKPTYADLKDMKYLNAVLNETMRLYPVVPFNVRHALVDTTLPTGGGPDRTSPIGVPAGTRIIYSTMLMQRREDLYERPPSKEDEKTGNHQYFNPTLFLPERWTSGWQPKPWHFIPFNGGPRICLGQQFATIEMGYTVVRILQHYSEIIGVGCPPSGTDPKLMFDVTLSPGQELNCLFRR
ncbi:hypothetical protein FQN57_000562 [Myotisia sp. PD_48]|nr:hypothetical protein FQN57_000562 [Myotisia sp. PD_48]